MLKYSDYKLEKVVKRKTNLNICKFSHSESDEQFIVRQYMIYDDISLNYKKILNEAILASKCVHNNILKFFGSSEKYAFDPASKSEYISFFLFYSHFDNTLKFEIQEKKRINQNFTFEEIRKIISDIIPAILSLEENKVAHLKIKPNKIVKQRNTYKVLFPYLDLVF